MTLTNMGEFTCRCVEQLPAMHWPSQFIFEVLQKKD
jgi:hypothetical protein